MEEISIKDILADILSIALLDRFCLIDRFSDF